MYEVFIAERRVASLEGDIMNRPPAFQFYPKDWLDFRVQRMSLAAQGAYMKLLCFMWADSKDQRSIEDNDDHLARALGVPDEQWLDLRKEIQHEFDPIFEQKDGRLLSARLRHEAAKQRKYRKSQAEKGVRSAQQRSNRGSTVVEPMYQPEGNSSSSSSSSLRKEISSKSTVASKNGHLAGFQAFWTAYPRKEGKGACERWWHTHEPDDRLRDTMLAKIEQAKKSPNWQDKGGKFIPMPATWLNQKRWEDEYPTPASQRERLPL